MESDGIDYRAGVDLHSKVYDFVVVAPQYYSGYVLADVVYVALDRSQEEYTLRGSGFSAGFEARTQYFHCAVHGAGALYNLRQKHLA